MNFDAPELGFLQVIVEPFFTLLSTGAVASHVHAKKERRRHSENESIWDDMVNFNVVL